MRVLMTGSSGFLGGALGARLTSEGHEVVRLVRREPRSGCAELRWDPGAGLLHRDSLEGMDAAVHLAGLGIGSRRWSERHKARVLATRVQGTRLLAAALAELTDPPAVLLSSSAIGYYGDRGDETLTEESVSGNGFLPEVCRAWERETAPARAAGMRVVVMRSGLVLSPKGGVFRPQLVPFRLGLGGRIGSGRQYWSWISLRDEIGAILHLLRCEDVAGPVNLTAPNPVTNGDFARTVGRVLRRPALIPVPARALRILLGAEMAGELLLASQRVLPRALEASGYRFEDPELEPALRALLNR